MNLNALFARKAQMVARADALPGRAQPIPTAARHFVSGAPLAAELPPGAEQALFGMGCFWGAERLFWQQPGVLATMSGYSGGFTPNPTYDEVCSGRTGHAEVVRVVYDPARTDYATLLRLFWESHDPTQGLRQGNDIGSQYRSALYTFSPGQQAAAEASRDAFAARLRAAGLGAITTEIAPAGPFYMAEDHHQQYLARNPAGYCGLQGTGVSCPVGVTA